MIRPRHIAVIDVGKSNAKLALVETGTMTEIAVVTRPNAVSPGPPWPHFDLDGHWAFFLGGLADFQRNHGVDGVSVTTHGASGVLLDAQGDLAAPMLDYEFGGPNQVASAYDAIRPDFSETGSPRLAGGLNFGAQLRWIAETAPEAWARTAHIVTYPQYWGHRLTGELATDVTSIGCHSDLWNPHSRTFSSLVDRLALRGRIASPRRPADILGTVTAKVASQTGLDPATPVVCGIHDSNASLYPHLLGRSGPFSVVSTGTWVVAMAVKGKAIALDPARDTMINVNALGDPVPSAKFMGGREYEVAGGGTLPPPSESDRRAVLSGDVMLLPAVEPCSGPFPGRRCVWSRPPHSDGARRLALDWYLALMTHTCLELIGAVGPVVVEGPFAANADYLDMLAALRSDLVEVSASSTGTSVGAAMLLCPEVDPPRTQAVRSADVDALRRYGHAWNERLGDPHVATRG